MAERNLKQGRLILVSIILILLFSNLSSYLYADSMEEPKKVLIINSYHQGLKWSKDETDGIIDTFSKSSNKLSIFVEYMDWKNYPTDENMQYLHDYFKYKYQSKKIDILIATDDIALKFVLKNRGKLFSNAPVVFCGVNQNGAAQITGGYKNLTGVLEEIDPTDTIKMALQINRSLRDVYILFDNSESGVSTGKIVVDKIKLMGANLNTIPLNKLSYDDLVMNIRSYDKNSIILATTYYSDGNGKIVEFENVSREVSKNSSVPVYHLYDMGLNNGAFGGVMISGRLQGEIAAKLAIDILHGADPDNIPVQSLKTTRKVFDYQQLKRFGVPLNIIPKDSEVVNKPFSFFETYKKLVLIISAAFAILISFVCILLFYIRQIRKMRKNISDSHEELTQTYEELTAAQEELKGQYDEILDNHEKIKRNEERLTYLAYHDILTGLPNKVSLYENSLKDIFLAQSGKTALLFIDIDHLKYINDTMGHAFGDQLLIQVSEKLRSLLNEDCSVYRLSGDEFIIIVEHIKGKEAAEAFASHILAGFKEEFAVHNSMLYISLSIGIAIYPEHGENLEDLLKYAEIAMHRVKETGRKSYIVYDQLMNEVFTERVKIEKHLHTALAKNEFEIYYQPQLGLKSNRITGLEALLRWKSPELGFVSPAEFIKVAEDTHLIIPLGAWVLRNACAFLKHLHSKGFTDMSMSVNISMLQLLQTDFSDIVMDTLKLFMLDPAHLELEITESILMESFESIGTKLEKLREIGVKVALDDFGKGYSSLSYLKQLPISTLKVDKSFIDNISVESNTNTLTGHIVTIGKSLGMCVIAEGVEKQEQLEYLIQHECDKIQGYFYSRPIPEAELIKLLELHQA